jgi:hypothetical protein
MAEVESVRRRIVAWAGFAVLIILGFSIFALPNESPNEVIVLRGFHLRKSA